MFEDFFSMNILTWDYFKLPNFKDFRGYALLPYLQANRLAYHSFMDAGRSETPESEAKGS